MNQEESVFFGALDQKTGLLESKPRRSTSNQLSSSIAKKSSRYVSIFCRESTFVFVLNYQLTTGTKKTGKKKTGKKACLLPHMIGKQPYSSVSLVLGLVLSSIARYRSRHVSLSCQANNREEENRDDRPSHFLSFSYYFKLPSRCIRSVAI